MESPLGEGLHGQGGEHPLDGDRQLGHDAGDQAQADAHRGVAGEGEGGGVDSHIGYEATFRDFLQNRCFF